MRSGLFFKSLYLRRVQHEGRLITVEDVIAEFNSKDDFQSKCSSAIAQLKGESCLNMIAINGQPVDASEVADSFPDTLPGKLALARFREGCCLHTIPIHGQPVTAESVVNDFLTINARLELGRFREVCCRKKIPIDGRPVSTELVVNDYLAINARLELARFKQFCCLESLAINGQQVSPEEVVDLIRAAGDKLGLTCFRRECFSRELPIAGQQVTPESVLKGFQELGARLEVARFLQECYQKGVNVEHRPVSAERVADSLQAVNAHLELARFRAGCCLKGQLLHNHPVSPEVVVDSFPASNQGRLGLAYFKASCCLEGFCLNGRPVSTEEVLSHFPKFQEGKMAKAHFMEECFLRNIAVNGQLLTAESVLPSFPNTPDGRLSLARFRENCCLKGLRIYGRRVSPDSVMRNFPDNRKGLISRARFREKCALRGLWLSGQPISTQDVLEGFPDTPEGRVATGRFLEQCLFRGLMVYGKTVTAEAVFKALDTTELTLAKACLQAELCLRGLPLHGRPVTTDMVAAAFPNNLDGQKHVSYFKQLCCLNNLPLAGKSVQPEPLVYDLEQKNKLVEKAYFYADLALQARKLNGKELSNDQVLDAFNQLKGNHSIRKVYFLMQRLIALPELDHQRESQATFEQAWQILANNPLKDERFRYQRCVLLFLAMKYALPLVDQPVTPDTVWQSIRALRDSFCNLRLQFYFLADCCFTDTALDGQPVSEQQVQDNLKKLPPSGLRLALGRWFEELCRRPCNTDALNRLLPSPGTAPPPPVRRPKRIDVYIKGLYTGGPFSYEAVERFDDPLRLDPTLISSQARKALGIIRGIRGLCFTGSFSRWLQGVGSSFNDIDMMASRETIITLVARLTKQLGNRESETAIPCEVLASEARGCPQLNLNPVVTITLSEGDLGQKVSVLQASVYPQDTIDNLNTVTAEIPGEHGTISCLTYVGEVKLLTDTLQFLADQLDDLTTQLLSGPGFTIPRTILFNYPQHRQECVFGLFMRCLLTLNKAKQFTALLACNDPGALLPELRTRGRSLHAKLLEHAHREPFIAALTHWLARPSPRNTYLDSRCTFIRSLLAMVSNPAELF